MFIHLVVISRAYKNSLCRLPEINFNECKQVLPLWYHQAILYFQSKNIG